MAKLLFDHFTALWVLSLIRSADYYVPDQSTNLVVSLIRSVVVMTCKYAKAGMLIVDLSHIVACKGFDQTWNYVHQYFRLVKNTISFLSFFAFSLRFWERAL